MKNFYKIIFVLVFSFFNSKCFCQSWHSFLTPTSSPVNSLIVYDGKLVIAPYGYNYRQILTWDGSSFDTIGTIFTSSPEVWAMEVYNNELYVGGEFPVINGVTVNNIAKWDGSNWYPLNNGITGQSNQVEALKQFNSELYVGGWFTEINGITVNCIAKWNGNAWDSVGQGFNNTVSSFAEYNNELYAGGFFTQSGIDTVNRIAKWNGTNWVSLGNGISGIPFVDRVRSMVEYQGELYVGGFFFMVDTVLNSLFIAKWNGTNWSNVGFTLPERVLAMKVYNNKLFIGGSFIIDSLNIHHIISWDGNTISDLNCGINPNYIPWQERIWDLAVFDNKLFVGGGFDSTYTLSSIGIAYWDEFTTSIDSFQPLTFNLQLNPNPFANELIVKNCGYGEIKIFDITGKEILHTKAFDTETKINTAHLTPGFYLVNYKEENKSVNKKVVKF